MKTKYSSKTCGYVKDLFTRRLLKEFPKKMDNLDTSYNKTDL